LGVQAALKPSDLEQFLQDNELQAFKIARAAVGCPEEALDIVQDAMMRLCKYYSGKANADWPPLFYRILNNRIMDHFRHLKSQQQWLKKDPEGRLEDSAVDHSAREGFQTLLNSQQWRALNQALADLPERQREAFLLRCWEGQSTASTASSMGCSEGSVKTHYSRALGALRHALQDLWP
jgi:RNA polymerase sigma-70 factor, ECF subfamily